MLINRDEFLNANLDVNALQNEAEKKLFYRGYSVADLRRVFNSISDPNDWKKPLVCTCKGETLSAVIYSIVYFLGDSPSIHLDMDKMVYTVSSKGYQAY